MTEPEEGAGDYELHRPRMRSEVIADALVDPEVRARFGWPPGEQAPLPVVFELNVRHRAGLSQAFDEFMAIWDADWPKPVRIAEIYMRVDLSLNQVRTLVQADISAHSQPDDRAIYRAWPDFPVRPLIDASVTTVKADAARRSYDAAGRDIVWAVVDSGIDHRHPHFQAHENLIGEVKELHRDFTVAEKDGKPVFGGALSDDFGHGTHVAGIIAGGLVHRIDPAGQPMPTPRVIESVQNPTDDRQMDTRIRKVSPITRLSGIAPYTKLVSLKVLDAQGRGGSMNVIRALEHVRREINGQSKIMRVHGVNLSVGYEFDAKWFACGQSPLCVEVDRLVRSGVVVVVAAGNTGYGTVGAQQRRTNVGLTMTINDPGNAQLAITVGSTHRYMPHTYGVSYFSSKGPTGDGRRKPDLVAPGERITSCAAGAQLTAVQGTPGEAVYVEDSGTSMASPHVSGVIAAFLSIRREFIGQPEEIKKIFTETATTLGREAYFQGAGLVDLMRAIQSV
jgi:subtilisin family serine protease